MTARSALAELLVAVAGDVPVLQLPLRQAAPPAYAIAPGRPYLRPSSAVPGCMETWRLDVWCMTTREDVVAMDTLDGMVDVVRAAVSAAGPDATGWQYLFLGIDQAHVDTTDLAGMPGRATIVQLQVSG